MPQSRINDLRRKMQAANLDALILTNMPQIRYLTGFTGDTAVLVMTRSKTSLLVDFRFADQSRREAKGASVTVTKTDCYGGLKDSPLLGGSNLRVGFSGTFVPVTLRDRLASMLPNAILINADAVLGELGWEKDAPELANIRKAAAIADTAFERVLSIVRPGVGENELAAELEYQMVMLGSEKPAFDTIVASGYRSAMPHGVASKKRVAKGDFVTFDFGATVGGSVCDITRTVVVGKATQRHKKVYGIVLKAQLAGIRKVRAGIGGKEVDTACRDIIAKAGYGKEFGHGTGHGIGIFIHMGPRVSSLSTDKLKPGNVITIEPGIYIPGWGGVRIEDDVVVTRSGGVVLNKAPKNLLEL
jgi:Xaa-Pro aminopeptidase